MRLVRIILELLFWALVAAAAMFALNVVLGWLFAPILGYVAAIGLLVLVPLATKVARVIRRRRAAVVVGYLEQAVRLNLPLDRILAAACRSEKGKTAYRIEQLRRRLEAGFGIGDSARRTVPELQQETAALLASAERLGRLPHALHKALRDQTQLAHEQAARGAFAGAYPFMMIVMLSAVIFMICVFVLPKYEQIFVDFGMRLPPMTMAMLRITDPYLLGLLTIALSAMLLWAGTYLSETFYPSARRLSIARRMRDRIVWSIPFAHGVARDGGLAAALDLASDAIRGGAPADRAMAEAARLHVNDVLQGRLEHWAEELAAGKTLQEAAKAALMPALVVEMLASVRGPETADVLAFLARHYAMRFSRGAALLSAAAVPVMVLLFALLVAWVCLSMITPMAMLIDNLSSASMRWRL